MDNLTPANLITITRILVSPILFIIILSSESTNGASWIAFIFGIALGVSDAFDGVLARATGSVTKLGAFLDPLADKVVVLGCMFSLLAIGSFHIVPVMIIAVREIGISIFRVAKARQKIIIPASKLAKWKTFAQGSTLLLAVLPPLESEDWLINIALWFAVVMTVVTGWQYIKNGNLATETLKRVEPDETN
ncbi:MAG: CDP-diacylglycerol--glycerol-3-phosphate 3-phosphatidyltransferase [Acidimicrobiaceae bacterium]|jgi:CDP-diacylglycerol--glycerol-3-phosphate 3-phosphatidyltransferase|nr:CDP-diacylglycerol--glycerol-3-phosphate 3-phosphatidyltransferase [Acidimicrobiaceae bacterium]|tara:strand:+ start:9328 stop:9900 length:573 start_codon:yes stop_codon:yes gene_type:complete